MKIIEYRNWRISQNRHEPIGEVFVNGKNDRLFIELFFTFLGFGVARELIKGKDGRFRQQNAKSGRYEVKRRWRIGFIRFEPARRTP